MSLSFDNTENAFRYKTTNQLRNAQILFSAISMPNVSAIGIWLTKKSIEWKLPVQGLIKKFLYNQFCGGENLNEVLDTVKALKQYNVDVCLDYGKEGAEGESNFDNTVQEFLNTISFAKNESNIPFIPLKVTGFANSELLEIISNNGDGISEEYQKQWVKVKERIDRICGAAADANMSILIDAEESWLQQAVDDLADEMMEKYNTDNVYIYNTFQLYRHDRLAFLKKSHAKALENNYKLGVKIVRGAYMEKERERAKQKAYLDPIQPNKEATDRDFNAAIDYCFQHLDTLSLFVGTHNEFSSKKAALLVKDKNLKLNDVRISFSQLYGMSDNITFNLAAQGYNASKYLPYGPLKDVVPYLLRRAQENTSVAGQTNRELDLINKELKRRKNK